MGNLDMAEAKAITRRDLETRLIEKAWKDPIFRKDVVNDPKGMLEKYTGQKLPEPVRIFVHEEDANTLHFSIPLAPSNLNELSDEDLEKVAGGTDIVISGLAFGVSYLAVVATAGAATAVGAGALVFELTNMW